MFSFLFVILITSIAVTISSNTGSVVTLTSISGTNLTPGPADPSNPHIASATTGLVAIATGSTDGTLNVHITGSVSTIKIQTTGTKIKTNGPSSSQEDGSFWLSDISACSAGSFSADYFAVAKPYGNQWSYMLASKDDQVYFADALTEKAKLLFTATGGKPINSLAYDPVNRYVYYVQDNSGAANANNKTLYRYHYDMDTLGPVMSDISVLIPTFDVGVETGGAAFYDGSLYFGIDIGGSGSYKCVIWKIDFDTDLRPASASQVFAIDDDNHDWGDFAVAKGMLYNFDGQAGSENYHHQDLYTKSVTVYTPAGSNKGK